MKNRFSEEFWVLIAFIAFCTIVAVGVVIYFSLHGG